MGTGLLLGESSCLDSSKWFSQGILGQILESIRNEASQIRGQSYSPPPPPTSSISSSASVNQGYQATVATTNSTPHITLSMLNYSSSIPQNSENQSMGLSTSSFTAGDPKPIPLAANIASSLDTALIGSGSTSASASTTPVSDTTASDTDHSKLHSQKSTQPDSVVHDGSMPMDDNVGADVEMLYN